MSRTVNALLEAAYAPLPVDRVFYDSTALSSGRELVESFVLPPRSGRAWKVPAGHVFRLSTPEGPQVGDLNCECSHIFEEFRNVNKEAFTLQCGMLMIQERHRFWASRTRQLQAAHVTTYDRLWSTLPFLEFRPMATIIFDTMKDYGIDADGGRVHDLLGTRCDPYINKYLTGIDRDVHCHSNLIRAIKPFGLTEFDVHDVLNVFQCTGLNAEDKYFMKTCPATADTYIEFFAEQDLIAALSTCPGGDLSLRMWGEGIPEGDDPALACCRPLRVEVFKLSENILSHWRPWEVEKYGGDHGIAMAESSV